MFLQWIMSLQDDHGKLGGWLYGVPPAHQSSNPRFDTGVSHLGRIFDSEAPVVTSSISRLYPPAQSFGGAHRGRVCVRAFIGVSVCTCTWASTFVLCFAKNNSYYGINTCLKKKNHKALNACSPVKMWVYFQPCRRVMAPHECPAWSLPPRSYYWSDPTRGILTDCCRPNPIAATCICISSLTPSLSGQRLCLTFSRIFFATWRRRSIEVLF